MFRKNKDRNDRRRILMYRILKGFTRFINRYSVRQFLIGAVIIAAAVIFTFEGFELIYKSSVITRQTALIQNEAVLISAEYSYYESLAEAERNSMNSRLSSYSALNQIRIRVVVMNVVEGVCLLMPVQSKAERSKDVSATNWAIRVSSVSTRKQQGQGHWQPTNR